MVAPPAPPPPPPSPPRAEQLESLGLLGPELTRRQLSKSAARLSQPLLPTPAAAAASAAEKARKQKAAAKAESEARRLAAGLNRTEWKAAEARDLTAVHPPCNRHDAASSVSPP
jgi:hypothetical protein